MIPELVTIHTSLLTDLGDAVRERWDLSGEMSIEEMTEKVRGLPSGYTRVEYLQSTGTQYINTGIYENDYAVAETDIQFTEFSSTAQYVGNYNSLYGSSYGLRHTGNWAWAYPTISETQYVIENGTADLNRHILRTDVKNRRFSVDNSAVTVSYVNTNRNRDLYVTFRLFARYNYSNQSMENWCKAKIYRHSFYNWNGAEIMRLIPCTRDSDSVAGMYDIINGQFYTNAGSGTFITP